MAGGIFTSRPFELNIKCIIFAFVIMSIYWFSPANKNWLLLPLIFIFSYITMAWYDYLYDCNTMMYSGNTGPAAALDSIFKPQRRDSPRPSDEQYKYLLEDQESEYLNKVYLFHLILVSPLLLYVGFLGANADKRVYDMLLMLGVLATGYHGFRLFVPRQVK